MSTPGKKSFEDMTDEELMQASPPEELFEQADTEVIEEVTEVETENGTEEETETEQEEVDSSGSEEETESENDEEKEDSEKDENEDEEKSDESDLSDDELPDAPVGKVAKSKQEKKKEPETEKEESEKEDDSSGSKEIDYKAEYERLMAGFKASGSTFTPRNLDEVIKLAQQGIDYTRKMQKLKPGLKVLQMLQGAELLDEDKINDLISLQKGEKGAIEKLLREKNISPMDLDPEEDTGYKPTDYRVSDAEVKFNSTLEEVLEKPSGRETVKVIERDWDRESQRRVFNEPEIMQLMDIHRNTGIYSQITEEISRLRLLGDIPEDTPFLDAYKTVGDALHENGRLLVDGKSTKEIFAKKSENNSKTPAKPPSERQVVARGPTVPKPKEKHAAARAAAIPRGNKTPPKQHMDYLSMSDDVIEKMASPPGR